LTTSFIVYLGNLFFKPVNDGEHDPDEPKAVILTKKYFSASKGQFSNVNGKILLIPAKEPKDPAQ
jgi:hypothetical protein